MASQPNTYSASSTELKSTPSSAEGRVQGRTDGSGAGSWRSLFSTGRRRDRKPPFTNDRCTVPRSTTSFSTSVSQSDIGRPVFVMGYGEGILMFFGIYHKTRRPRAGVAFNRPIGLNNGTIDNHIYFRCPPRHGVLVELPKVSILSEGAIAAAVNSGLLMNPGNIGVMGDSAGHTSRFEKPKHLTEHPAVQSSIPQSPNADLTNDVVNSTVPPYRTPSLDLPQVASQGSKGDATDDAISIASAFSIVSMTQFHGQGPSETASNYDNCSLSSRASISSSVASSICHDFVHVSVN